MNDHIRAAIAAAAEQRAKDSAIFGAFEMAASVERLSFSWSPIPAVKWRECGGQWFACREGHRMRIRETRGGHWLLRGKESARYFRMDDAKAGGQTLFRIHAERARSLAFTQASMHGVSAVLYFKAAELT